MSTSPNNPVTLATIAAHLGVSRSTVSNAYNHPDQLSPALRERIFATAEQLGYTGPDPVARRLRQGSAGAIGVLFSERLQYAFSDPAAVLFLEGIAAAGKEEDSGMLLIPARPSETGAQVVQNAIVDGFILYSIPPKHPFVEAALRRKLPVVCVDQTQIDGVSWVGIDDHAAAVAAAEHLVGLGHRRLAVIAYGVGEDDEDEGGQPTVSRLRLQGYEQACAAAGIEWSSVPVLEYEHSNQIADHQPIRHLLSLPQDERPTGFLCTSDTLALAVVEEAKTMGLSIPDQVSVIGFNDVPAAATANPPLTTMRQPLMRKGEEAARLLFEGHAGPDSQVMLEAELVVRGSTGPAAS